MKTCRQCGTTLADQAQYCMQCGTPVAAPSPRSAASETGEFFQPALLAGVVLGVLSSIPIVNLGNCVCCMWVLGGGGLGAWLLGRKRPGGPGAMSFGDGAFVGALSGLFGGLLATVVSIPFRMLAAGAAGRADLEAMLLEIVPDIDPELLDAFLQFADFSLISVVVTLLWNVVIFSLFAMIGGILLVAVMGKKSSPAPPPEVEP